LTQLGLLNLLNFLNLSLAFSILGLFARFEQIVKVLCTRQILTKKRLFAPPPFFFGPIWAKRVHRSKLPGQMVQKNEKCILPFCLHFEAGKKKKKDLKKKKKDLPKCL